MQTVGKVVFYIKSKRNENFKKTREVVTRNQDLIDIGAEIVKHLQDFHETDSPVVNLIDKCESCIIKKNKQAVIHEEVYIDFLYKVYVDQKERSLLVSMSSLGDKTLCKVTVDKLNNFIKAKGGERYEIWRANEMDWQ